MLGRTAGGLFWMFRYLERSENAARLIEVGFRIALTRSVAASQEWASVLTAAGVIDDYDELHERYDADTVINYLLREKRNSGSVLSMVEAARTNAREVRTALTREVFEATNESYLELRDMLARPVKARDLPTVLGAIKRQSALVRGALHGTMLRNDMFSFARIGTFLERADNTARILDVKYHVLLPSVAHVGAAIDNVQWETILRTVSALRAARWLPREQMTATGICAFLILDPRLPRSLRFCSSAITENLNQLAQDYGKAGESLDAAGAQLDRLRTATIEEIMEAGLHETLEGFILANAGVAHLIEKDYRFYG